MAGFHLGSCGENDLEGQEITSIELGLLNFAYGWGEREAV